MLTLVATADTDPELVAEARRLAPVELIGPDAVRPDRPTVVLPLAEQVLSAADWAEVNAAFAANRDPLAGHPPDDAYLPLFVKIVTALPAPLGLGSALQALAASGAARLAAER